VIAAYLGGSAIDGLLAAGVDVGLVGARDGRGLTQARPAAIRGALCSRAAATGAA